MILENFLVFCGMFLNLVCNCLPNGGGYVFGLKVEVDGVIGEYIGFRNLSAQRGQFSDFSVCSLINPSEVLTLGMTLVCAFCPKGNVLFYWPQCDS